MSYKEHPDMALAACSKCGRNKKRDSGVGMGTYSATVRDVSDPMKLWTMQEYGGGASWCVWKTRVIGFRITGR